MWKDEDGKNDGTDKIETTSDGTDGTLTEIADLKALETQSFIESVTDRVDPWYVKNSRQRRSKCNMANTQWNCGK